MVNDKNKLCLNLEDSVAYLMKQAQTGIVISYVVYNLADITALTKEENYGKYILLENDGAQTLYVISRRANGELIADNLGQFPAGTVGPRGPKGDSPVITISDNSTWVIDGVDTGRSSRGLTGAAGHDGIPGVNGAGWNTLESINSLTYEPTITHAGEFDQIETVADLKSGASTKQITLAFEIPTPESYTAGDGITIVDHEISIDDTVVATKDYVNNLNIQGSSIRGAFQQVPKDLSFTNAAIQETFTTGAFGEYSVALNGKSHVAGERALVGGTSSVVKSNFSFAYGNANVCDAQNSATIAGSTNVNQGREGFIGGGLSNKLETAAVKGGIIGGAYNTNSGIDSVICGGSNNEIEAAGTDSLVSGTKNTNSAPSSFVTGGNNTNTGAGGFVGGTYNENEMSYGTALGHGNKLTGTGSTGYALGWENRVNHSFSGALGYELQTGTNGQLVVGSINKGNNDTIFEVGNGYVENDVRVRQNAFEVYKDGHAEVAVQGETNNSVATKEYVDTHGGGGGSGLNVVTLSQITGEGSTNLPTSLASYLTSADAISLPNFKPSELYLSGVNEKLYLSQNYYVGGTTTLIFSNGYYGVNIYIDPVSVRAVTRQIQSKIYKHEILFTNLQVVERDQSSLQPIPGGYTSTGTVKFAFISGQKEAYTDPAIVRAQSPWAFAMGMYPGNALSGYMRQGETADLCLVEIWVVDVNGALHDCKSDWNPTITSDTVTEI